MKNMNCGCLEQKRSWIRDVQNGHDVTAAEPMIKNADGSCIFNGRRCFLIDNGGRLSAIWL